MKTPYYACRSNVDCEIKIKLPDGTEVNTQRPKLHVFQRIVAMQEQLANADSENTLHNIAEMLALILSKNKEKRTFTADYLFEELEPGDMIAIVNLFFDKLNGLAKDPN